MAIFCRRIHGLAAGGLLSGAVAIAATESSHWKAPAEWHGTEVPIEATPSNLEAGAGLYAEQCARCHGSGGRGNGEAAGFLDVAPGDLTESEDSIGEIFWKVTNGRRPMPAYGLRLASDDRWRLALFVHSLGAAERQSKSAAAAEGNTETGVVTEKKSEHPEHAEE